MSDIITRITAALNRIEASQHHAVALPAQLQQLQARHAALRQAIEGAVSDLDAALPSTPAATAPKEIPHG